MEDCIQQKSKISEHASETCIFCKIAKGDIPCSKVYEDDSTIAFLDINPVSKGHTLVIPKGHFEKIYEMDAESEQALMSTVSKVAKSIEKTFDCDFNILNNNGEKAGQVVKHVHFHIIPRTGEEKFNFNWPSGKYPEGETEELLKKIKDNL